MDRVSEHTGRISSAAAISLTLSDEALELLAEFTASLVLSRLTERHEYMSTEDVAAYLGCAKKRIDNLCSQGAIPFKKVGGRRLFRRSELDNWFEAQHGVSVESALMAAS